MKMSAAAVVSMAVGLVLVSTGVALGQGKQGTRSVTLPFNLTDNVGNQWLIYGNGMVQQQGGNAPVFAQLAQVTVNGANINMRGNQQGKVDEKTGELLLENLVAGGVSVTRRVLIDPGEGSIRFVDTFKAVGNNAGKAATVNLNYSNNFNFGIMQARTVMDPRRKDQPMGWAAMTHGNRAIHQTWAAAGSKLAPKINWPEGSNVLQVAFALEIPAGKEASLVHYHGSTETLEKAAELVGGGAKGAKLLAGVSPELRRTVANAVARSGAVPEELELIRGEGGLDVVEIRNGDLLRGTLTDATFAIKTAYGRVELPAERVIAVLSVGRLKPLQLLVTAEGEVFGGQLESGALAMRLSSGQTVNIPITQLTRAGYRVRDSETDDALPLGKPLVTLRTGERMAIAIPGETLEVATRYGLLKLPVAAVGEVQLKSDDSPVHVITLSDGSRISGLLTTSKFDFLLDGAAGRQTLSVPASAVLRLRPSPLPVTPADDAARSEMLVYGDDVLRGQIIGTLQLDTAFETVDVRGDQLRGIARSEEGNELRVTLWDQTVLTGQPRLPSVSVRLDCGVTVEVAVDLIQSFTNPAPKPSDAMAERVKSLVSNLNDDDFKKREGAQIELIAAGAVVVPLLEELKPAQPPEAQQRIEQILIQLKK